MRRINHFHRTLLKRIAFIVVFFSLITAVAQACTIFVMTGENQTLFCNNEDWSNFKTMIWFVEKAGHYSCAYVGFDNGWAQGGLNTEGLAFDWVAGYKEKWEPDPNSKAVSGNPAQRMLETCCTVKEAITFFQTHKEPSFSYAKILIADSNGSSVIIGAKDGRIDIQESNQSRGFGYGGQVVKRMLAENSDPNLNYASKILTESMQKGQYATKYSNIFDLKTGDIFVFNVPGSETTIKLNLADELKKGSHYYDIPDIGKQINKKPMPLLQNMNGN